MAFELPSLGYDFDDLEPTIDAKPWKFTMANTMLATSPNSMQHSKGMMIWPPIRWPISAGIWTLCQNPFEVRSATMGAVTTTTLCSGR